MANSWYTEYGYWQTPAGGISGVKPSPFASPAIGTWVDPLTGAGYSGSWKQGYVPTTVKSPTSGQVLGAKTAPTNGDLPTGDNQPPGGEQPPAPSGPSPEEIYRQQVEGAYGELSSQLDKMAGLLPEMKSKWEETINTAYQTLTEGTQSELESSLKRLQGYREQVGERQALTLRDLATNLRNMLMAGNIYLGARGAGASSATPMYAYALSKLSSRQRADVLRQANEQLNEINMKEEDVRQTAAQELNNIKLWKEGKVSEIAQWFDQQKLAIENTRAKSIEWKNQQLLASLQDSLNWLRQLDAQAIAYQQSVQDWATQRLAELNNYKIQMGQLGSFNPRELVWQELPGINTPTAGRGTTYSGWNPWARAKEEEEQNISSAYWNKV